MAKCYEIGMGWLGWTEQETAATRLPLIEIAHKGRVDMVLAIQGALPGGESAPAAEPLPAETVMGQMRSIFGGTAQKPRQ